MRRITAVTAALAATLGAVAIAQQAPASAEAAIKQLGLFVYPAKDQTKDQQAKDEKACYDWVTTLRP